MSFYVAVCVPVLLQCVLQYVAVCNPTSELTLEKCLSVLRGVAVCYVVCCSVLQCVTLIVS